MYTGSNPLVTVWVWAQSGLWRVRVTLDSGPSTALRITFTRAQRDGEMKKASTKELRNETTQFRVLLIGSSWEPWRLNLIRFSCFQSLGCLCRMVCCGTLRRKGPEP